MGFGEFDGNLFSIKAVKSHQRASKSSLAIKDNKAIKGHQAGHCHLRFGS